MNRRKFISASLQTTAALSVTGPLMAEAAPQVRKTALAAPVKGEGPHIIDSNINLFEFPFRKLKYGNTRALIEKLKKHRIEQAWAGSFDALFSKNIQLVNAHLAEECRKEGQGMLLPFGTVNPAWPDWEEDLRQCHEVHRMPGIRIYPVYQTIDFEHPEFALLLKSVAARGLILQIAVDMEDIRHVHPIVELRNIKFDKLIGLLKGEPRARVQLLHWNGRLGGKVLDQLIAETSAVLDISRLEGAGAVGRLIEGKTWSGNTAPVPVERLLFGSHAPYFPVEANLLRLFESPLNLEQMTAIMHTNAGRFLPKSEH